MDIRQQVARLVGVGVPARAGMGEDEFRALAGGLHGGGIVCVHPSLVPASVLAGLLERAGRPGFVVEDMTDLADFEPLDGLQVPERSLYLLHGVERGDDLRGWTPNDALPAITARGRTPLTISEGISWLLQEPDRLEQNRCFMCIGSRKRGPRGLDARTPAITLSALVWAA